MTNLKHPMQVVNEQAEDAGIWFISTRATEEYLQRELRKLHQVIEDWFQPEEVKNDKTV